MSDTSKYSKVKRDLHQRVKNNVRHVMSIIFLPNDKLNHKRSSSGVVGADEPLQWGRALNKQHFDDSSDSIKAMTKPVPEDTKT